METWIKELKEMGACPLALEWGGKYKSLADAWAECERGDWMLWLVGYLSGEPGSEGRRKLVLTACQCVRLALPYVEKGEIRPLQAIETAEAWARSENRGTLEDVRNAVSATYAVNAVYTAVNAAGDNAVNAAINAVYIAVNAAGDTAVNAAINATNVASYIATYAVNDVAYTATLKKCADIVRLNYDAPVVPG